MPKRNTLLSANINDVFIILKASNHFMYHNTNETETTKAGFNEHQRTNKYT